MPPNEDKAGEVINSDLPTQPIKYKPNVKTKTTKTLNAAHLIWAPKLKAEAKHFLYITYQMNEHGKPYKAVPIKVPTRRIKPAALALPFRINPKENKAEIIKEAKKADVNI